jgi:PIN domain nuclease of toxin-antitoxin system
MRLLIDTHTFLWFINDSSQLSTIAKTLLESDADLWISIASLWEIAVKVSIGKLTLPQPFDAFIPLQLQTNKIEVLQIAIPHLNTVSTLPLHHRDPFDRLLIAQALVEQVPIIGGDTIFDDYGINRIW